MKLQIGLAMLVVPVIFGQSISSLSPSSTAAGGPSFTLMVSGSGFVNGLLNSSSVEWNGSALSTTFVSANQLNAVVPASLITSPGSVSITVVNPGGSTSNMLTFTITGSNGGPTLSSLNPSSATPGGPGFTLMANGSGFQNGATVNWNGSALSTGFITGSQLSAFVPANLIATAGTASVTVMNPGGATSNALIFTIGSAAPVLTSLNPSSASPGGSAFTLTVNGSGFLSGATVEWNGSALSTGFISANQLSAFVPSNLIATVGTASVTVMNPGGATSNALIFTIGSATPVLTSLNPSSASPGGSAFTLTVNGSGFLSGATVEWNGSALSTGFISGNQLSAFVPSNLIATAGTASVTVMNPGGAVSNALTFMIGSAPILTSLNPASAIPGGAGFTLTVNGSGFLSGAVVQWNGSALSTGFINGNQLSAFVPANLIATTGTASVTAVNPGGVVSNALTFTISSAQAPTLTSLSPSFAQAGGPAFTLTVFGSGFVSGAVVQWNGAALSTGFISATQLSAFVAANLIANQGSASITAVNPGGAVSNTLAFSISPLGTPLLSSVSPSTVNAGGPAFTMTVSGSNFANGAVVQWNGQGVGTTFMSATQLSATVAASLIAAPGTANVTVVNPGGGTSNTLVFTITGASTLTLSSLSPNSASAGGPGFTLTALGSGFVIGSNLEWDGAVLSTNFVSATQLSASVPAILIANAGTANVTVLNPGGAMSNGLTFSTFGFSSALRVAQIADGSNWKTLFQVVNLDVTPVNFAFQFWDDNGNSLALPLISGASTFSGTLPVGGTAFAETPGTATALTQGWAEAASNGRIGVLTIFRQIVPGRPDSEGTVTGVLSGSRVFLPFDDTNGYVTGVAIANTNPTQALFLSLTFQLENGSASTGAVSLPPHGHTAFVLTTMFPALAGVRGSMEITASTPDIAVVGLRFSPNNSFTSLGEFQ
jgi:alpha-D-ribose 1-methylphosphonate 5-triphosphate synthase subunit PhnH